MFARMLFTGAILFSAAQAHAASDTAPSDKFYLGGGAGQAVYHSDTLDDIDDFEGTNVDEKDAAYTLFGGYRFNPNFSMEVGYVNLGEATGKISGVGEVASFEVDGVSASLLGRLPIDGGLSVIGRLGVIKWDSEAKAFNEKEKDNGTDPLFGGGLEYSNQSLFARAEYTRYMLDVDSGSSDEDVDIDLWSLSAGMYF